MSYWGDSPRGMVESALEFAHIMRKHDFHNFVFSMKASNPLVMVQAYRLLSVEMYKLGWDYPLHLGVTEAGEGEDGRMKSAIGIGSLLADGLGDTVRVSLTEDPEFELQPCQTLIDIGAALTSNENLYKDIPAWKESSRNILDFTKRRGVLPAQQEGDAVDFRGCLHRDGSVLSVVSLTDLQNPESLYEGLGTHMAMGLPFKVVDTVDSIYLPEVPPVEDKQARRTLKRLQDISVCVLAPIEQLQCRPLPNSVAVISLADILHHGLSSLPEGSIRYAVTLTGIEPAHMYEVLKSVSMLTDKIAMIILQVPAHVSRVHASRRAFQMLADIACDLPVIHAIHFDKPETSKDELILRVGSEIGALLVDGLGDGAVICAQGYSLTLLRKTTFNLLQGARMRSVKTDFVSCPSCGRTLFDLQEVTEQIKKKTGHLPGVAIAIMGCIVNGPGEMADADFGYVGGAPGKVDLYVGKEVVRRGVPNEQACDALVQLIKDHGRWIEPRVVENSSSSSSIVTSSNVSVKS